jgi:hypothetical protein
MASIVHWYCCTSSAINARYLWNPFGSLAFYNAKTPPTKNPALPGFLLGSTNVYT